MSCLPLSPDKSASGKSLKGARDVPSRRGENDPCKVGDGSDFPSEAYEGSSTVTMVGTITHTISRPDTVSSVTSSTIMSWGI